MGRKRVNLAELTGKVRDLEIRRLARAEAMLARPFTEPCEKCGSTELVQRHHHKGYDGENATDVIFLCYECHAEAERSAGHKL